MRIFTPESFVEYWTNSKIKWQTHEAIQLPLAFRCPNCKQGIVLAHSREDQEKQFVMIAGHFALFIPKDMPKNLLEKMWTDIIRPAFFQWLDEKGEAEKTTGSQSEVGGATPPPATITKEA